MSLSAAVYQLPDLYLYTFNHLHWLFDLLQKCWNFVNFSPYSCYACAETGLFLLFLYSWPVEVAVNSEISLNRSEVYNSWQHMPRYKIVGKQKCDVCHSRVCHGHYILVTDLCDDYYELDARIWQSDNISRTRYTSCECEIKTDGQRELLWRTWRTSSPTIPFQVPFSSLAP